MVSSKIAGTVIGIDIRDIAVGSGFPVLEQDVTTRVAFAGRVHQLAGCAGLLYTGLVNAAFDVSDIIIVDAVVTAEDCVLNGGIVYCGLTGLETIPLLGRGIGKVSKFVMRADGKLEPILENTDEVVDFVDDKIDDLPIGNTITTVLATSISAKVDSYTNVASDQRTQHILYGDSTGGGHLWPGSPGKTSFPETWDANKVMFVTSDLATNPDMLWKPLTGNGGMYTNAGNPARFLVTDINGNLPVVDGIPVRVIIEPAGEGIITSYPKY